MRAVMISLVTSYYRQISQVIEIELKKWEKRAEEQHGIRLSWSPEGMFDSSSA
jgi:hypothetical protein